MKKIPYTALSDINFSERRIIQKGQMGLKRTFTEVTTHANGKVTRKILDYTADDRLPIDEIIEVGTKVVSQPSPGQGQDQPKESNKASQGQAQSRPADKESLVPSNPQAAVLPQTGESDPSLIFGMAALSILASVGLVKPRSKRQ